MEPTRIKPDFWLVLTTCIACPIINILVYQSAWDSGAGDYYEVLFGIAFVYLPVYLIFVFFLSAIVRFQPFTLVCVVLWVVCMALANVYLAVLIVSSA